MRRALLLLLVMMLAGCNMNGKRGDVPLAVYDLGPAGERLVAPRPLALAVEVRAPLWLDTLGIDYRLAYTDAARLREYARARWAGPPTQLIEQRLIHQLGLIPAGQGRAVCVLRLDLTEFSQIFASPDSSRAVVQGRAQWLDRGRSRLAEREIDLAVVADSADARGGVTALTAAVGQLTAALRAWEIELVRAGTLKGCAS